MKASLLPLRYFITLFVSLILGFTFLVYQYRQISNENRQDLAEFIHVVAAAINPDRVTSLTGTSADLSSPDYLRLQEQFTLLGQAFPHTRYLYLFRYQEGKVSFLLDSQPPQYTTEDEELASPGEVYDEADSELIDLFFHPKVVITSPQTDKWGTFVSALIPIQSRDKQSVLAVAGVDVDASYWRDTVNRQFLPYVVGAVLILVIELLLIFSRQQDRHLTLRLNYLAAVLESTTDAIFSVDIKYNIRSWNHAAELLFGFSADEIVSRPLTSLAINSDDKAKIGQYLHKLSQQGTLTNIRDTFHHQSGTPVQVIFSASSLFDPNRRTVGYVCIIRDNSEQAKSEKMMSDRNLELEKLNRLMINRELKMIQLKKKLKEVAAK